MQLIALSGIFEAKQSGKSIWQLTGISANDIITVNTRWYWYTPEEMAATAAALDTPKIKVKLDGEIPLKRN